MCSEGPHVESSRPTHPRAARGIGWCVGRPTPRTDRPVHVLRQRLVVGAPVAMPSIFASLSACSSSTAAEALLQRGTIDAKVSSHALHCLAKMPRDGDIETICIKLMHAIASASAALSSREISKAAWGIGKLWSDLASRPEPREAALHALDALGSQAVKSVDELDAQAVATMLHTHGTVGRAPSNVGVMRALQRRFAAATLRSWRRRDTAAWCAKEAPGPPSAPQP